MGFRVFSAFFLVSVWCNLSLGYEVTNQQALSAEARGELAKGLTREVQDRKILEYAEAFLSGKIAPSSLAKEVGLPVPLADLPGRRRGSSSIMGLQEPLQFIFEIAFRRYFRNLPYSPVAPSQFDFQSLSSFITHLYLASLI